MSQAVLREIEKHSKLAWPILKTQCQLLGLDPSALRPGDIPALAPALATATARFTTPEKGRRLLAELLETSTASATAPSGYAWASPLASPRLDPKTLSARALEILHQHTALAWTILDAQARRMGFDPSSLTEGQLAALVPAIEVAVARFSSQATARDAAAQLRDLVR